MRSLLKALFGVFALCMLLVASLPAQVSDEEAAQKSSLQKPAGNADDAYGRLNKGEIINVVGNYGTISDSYLQNVIYNFSWPKSKGAETSHIGSEDATDDFSIIFATASAKNLRGTGTVIDGYTNYSKEDWRGVDGAAGHYHCAVEEQREYLLAPDGTPMMATSDLPETWPAGWMDDDHQWPGVWHPGPKGPYGGLSESEKAMVDSLAGWYDPDYDVWRFWPGSFRVDRETGKQVPGEFAGDRHVWCIMDDDDNLQGPKVGVVVEMEGICYGRPYAEDFQFYDFTIRNESGAHLDSCWWGYYIDPKFGDVDEEELYTYNSGINPNDQYNVFINYDPNGQTAPSRWREIGVFGIAVLQTPHDVGVTDAHFNPEGGANPTSDWELWAQITGNPSDPLAPQPTTDFFHGSNPHLDDFSMNWGHPTDYGYLVMSGPFSMEPGEQVKATIVVSAGADLVENMSNKSELESGDFAKNIQTATEMFTANFQGPSGPPAPTLYGIPGDRQVTLYWDNLPETKPDPFSGQFDFEGYKIYRSVDDGASWGTTITNAFGQVVGYVPIAQFDAIDDIQGIDPVDGNHYLGNNTGLVHTFVDKLVNNGVRYTYSITGYDRGDPEKPLPSYESARGTDPAEPNVVRITPRSEPIGLQDPEVTIESHAIGNGQLSVEVIDPPSGSQTYRVGFSEAPAQEFLVMRDDQVLATYPLNSTVDFPLLEGIRFSMTGDTQFGDVKTVTDEFGRDILGAANLDTTGEWFVFSAEMVPGTKADEKAIMSDYEIRFTDQGSWASRTGPNPQLATLKVPFEVWNVTQNPPVQTSCLISSNEYKYGDVLYVGSAPYTATAEGDTLSKDWKLDFPYRVILRASDANQNFDLPLVGQKVKISTNRGFTLDDYFIVTIGQQTINATSDALESKLNDIRVVPNPYVVNAQWETQQNERHLRFMFLPATCDISIYTVAGELVAELYHNDGTGDHDWSMVTQTGQEISYGIYIYVVKAMDEQGISHQKIGRFMVIK